MKLPEKDIAQLLLKKLTGNLTAGESTALESWRLESPANNRKYQELTHIHTLRHKLKNFTEAAAIAETTAITEAAAIAETTAVPQQPEVPSSRIILFRWAAAAIFLFIASGIYIWTRSTKKDPPITFQSLTADIPPGRNKATLTLGDGHTLSLDSTATGQLAIQGSTKVLNTGNGKLTYTQTNNASAAPTLYNTLSTPNGGQYQLILPDGTRVWLNAASSITYPTTFSGTQRLVEITGEAFFDVAKDKTRPFFVTSKGRQSIEVLGTSFNVNSYDNEPQIQTTLINGSIKIIPTQQPAPSPQAAVKPAVKPAVGAQAAAVILTPGQQSILTNTRVSVTNAADIEKVTAWKNGLFNFNNADVPTVMRQLERWYDIHVQYTNAIPDIHFKGELDRGVNLSEMLKILPEVGIRYRMQDRTLIVL